MHKMRVIISIADRGCQQVSVVVTHQEPARGGSFGGLESVVIHHYQELVRYLSRTLGDRQAAADVAQESVLRLLERKSLAAIEQPRAFLFRTAINLSVDRYRRAQVRADEPLESLGHEELDDTCDPQVQACQAQQLRLLKRALDELPPVCRQAFLMRKVEGCSHAEIAESMGISRDMVEKHIVNAMKHCRMRLRRWAR